MNGLCLCACASTAVTGKDILQFNAAFQVIDIEYVLRAPAIVPIQLTWAAARSTWKRWLCVRLCVWVCVTPHSGSGTLDFDEYFEVIEIGRSDVSDHIFLLTGLCWMPAGTSVP